MTTKPTDHLENFKQDIGEEAFAVWERVLRTSQTNVVRNVDAECNLLEAEPTNEGVSIEYAELLLSELAKEINQGK